MITNDLQEFFTDTIQWAALVSRDSYGVPSFGQAFTYPARVVKKNKLVRDKSAQQVVSTSQIWVGQSNVSGTPFPLVKPVDCVTLSDGTKPQILDCEIFQDEQEGASPSMSHTVIFLV